MTAWLKFVHVASIVFWCGGLFTLPLLFAHRPEAQNAAAVYRLQRFVRYAYVQAISPAAFLAVATGIGLIFLAGVFTPWMALKLLAVGLLVLLHLRAGYVIQHLFKPGRRYGRWRQRLAISAVAAVAGLILWLVLAKPPLETERLPAWLVTPGALQSLVETMSPIP